MHLRTQTGFTLPELIMTIAILAFSLSAVLASFLNSVALNDISRNLTTADSHVQFILEDIRNNSFSNIPTLITANTWNWNTANVSAQGLTALNTETTTVSSSGTNPLTLTVTVNWHDLNNRVRTRTIKTMVSG